MVHLSRGLTYTCRLDVAGRPPPPGSIPVSWSFAMEALPPGRRLATPPPLGPMLTDPARIAAKPEEFERLLRAEIALAKP